MAGGYLDGGRHLCRGHAARGHRLRRNPGNRGQLDLVELSLQRHDDGVFFARLWRRAEIITDVELVELRYAGKPAAFLRGFRALYFGVLMNCLIVGWVNLAMEKIVGTVIPAPGWFVRADSFSHLSPWLTDVTHAPVDTRKAWALLIIFGIIAVTSFYTFISGLWGVLWFALRVTSSTAAPARSVVAGYFGKGNTA